MNSSQKIPWKRISVEAAAIVASILLAFAIDAWWENRQVRITEQSALQTLRDDFVASREELHQRLQNLENSQHQFIEFESLSPDELEQLPQSAAHKIVVGLMTGSTFDPYLGTIDAIVADGRLALIQDQEIRRLLSLWIKTVEDSEEDSNDVRSLSVRVRTSMEPHGGPFHMGYFDQLGAPTTSVLPRANGPTLAELRRDPQVMGALRSLYYSIAFYLVELNTFEGILDDTIALLDENIR